MSHNIIITIARQFGSGGHEIGRRLAKKLDIPLYDKELITHAAEESGLSEEILHYFDDVVVKPDGTGIAAETIVHILADDVLVAG